jgi:hypothetical protein
MQQKKNKPGHRCPGGVMPSPVEAYRIKGNSRAVYLQEYTPHEILEGPPPVFAAIL